MFIFIGVILSIMLMSELQSYVGILIGISIGLLMRWVDRLQRQVDSLSRLIHSSEQVAKEVDKQTKGTEFSMPESHGTDSDNSMDESNNSKPIDLEDAIPTPNQSPFPADQMEPEVTELTTIDIHEESKLTENNIDTEAPTDSSNVALLTAKDTVTLQSNENEFGQEPSKLELGIQRLKEAVVVFFTGKNALVRVGMLVLFVGVAFLLKYVTQRVTVPVEWRYIGVVLGAFGLSYLGWRLRKKRPGYSVSLQGGALGIIYITLYTAMRLHNLLPPWAVFCLMVLIVLLAGLFSVLQNSLPMAVIGAIGGFAAPILASTGSGSHVQLFSYYLLLNIGIFGVAWYKSWRLLNLVGFVATFGVGAVWGHQYYRPAMFNTVEPFLILNFLMYTSIAVLYAMKQNSNVRGLVDGTLVFGTPLVGFSLQAALTEGIPYALAYSSLVLGIFYLLLVLLLNKLWQQEIKQLIESFLALSIGFLTLAVPLAFDGRVTSALWVVEAAALIWVGVRQQRLLPRYSGYALTLLGMAMFFLEKSDLIVQYPWLNADHLGRIMVVLSTGFVAYYLHCNAQKIPALEKRIAQLSMLVMSVLWWTIGGIHENTLHFKIYHNLINAVFLSLTTFVCIRLAHRIKLSTLKPLSLLPAFIQMFIFLKPMGLLEREVFILNHWFVTGVIVGVMHIWLGWYWSREIRHELGSKYNQLGHVFLISGLIILVASIQQDFNAHLGLWQHASLQVVIGFLSLVILYVGMKSNLLRFQYAALCLLLFMLVLLAFVPSLQEQSTWLLNPFTLTKLFFSLYALFLAWVWHGPRFAGKPGAQHIADSTLALGLIFWHLPFIEEIFLRVQMPEAVHLLMAVMMVSAFLFVWLGQFLKWPSIQIMKYLCLPGQALLYLTLISKDEFIFPGWGALIWLAGFVSWYLMMFWQRRLLLFSKWHHLLTFILYVLIGLREWPQLLSSLAGPESVWQQTASLSWLLIIGWGVWILRDSKNWPFRPNRNVYFAIAFPFILGLLMINWLVINFDQPIMLGGFIYLPLLNPIDVFCVLALFLLFNLKKSELEWSRNFNWNAILGAFVFFLMNTMMLRCIHVYTSIDYDLKGLLGSSVVQTGFSLLWSTIAVSCMIVSTRKSWRTMWLVGLSLLGIVVAKLFLVDMSASGTIERIVAFLSVGVLLSLVGYFSPLPPSSANVELDEQPLKSS